MVRRSCCARSALGARRCCVVIAVVFGSRAGAEKAGLRDAMQVSCRYSGLQLRLQHCPLARYSAGGWMRLASTPTGRLCNIARRAG